jgi:hypothetical protein
MEKCKLICMGFDGDHVTEGEFNSVNEAWERSEDMGSRWFFYPFHFVLTEAGTTIKDSPVGLNWLTGKRLSTVKKIFSELAKDPDMKNATAENFHYALHFMG